MENVKVFSKIVLVLVLLPIISFAETNTLPEIEEGTVTLIEDSEELNFNDVPEDSYYVDAVKWAIKNNILKGTSQTTFSPEIVCTRAQVITFIWNLKGNPEPQNENLPFTDISKDDFCYKAICWAYENGITSGISETLYGVDIICTRAEIVTFLWHMSDNKIVTTDKKFEDVEKGSYYENAVNWAIEEKITSGTTETAFCPDDDCIRAQVVTFLYKFNLGK